MGWKWLWRIGHSSWVASRKLFLGRLLIDQVIYSWGLGFFVVFHIIWMVNRFDQFEMQACLGFKLQTLCVGIPANLRNLQISHYQLSIWFALYGHTGQWLTPKLIADNYRPIHHSNLLFSLFPVSVVFGSYLNINKATKLDMGAYLCVANNSIPAAISKRVWLGVTCKFAFSFWLDGIRQIRNIQGATTTTADEPLGFLIWDLLFRSAFYLLVWLVIRIAEIFLSIRPSSDGDSVRSSFKCQELEAFLIFFCERLDQEIRQLSVLKRKVKCKLLTQFWIDERQ